MTSASGIEPRSCRRLSVSLARLKTSFMASHPGAYTSPPLPPTPPSQALVSTQLPVPLKLRCIKGLGLPGGRLPPVLLCITTEGPRCEGPRRHRKPREVGKVLEDREGDGLTLTSDSGPVRHFFRKSNHPWSCERRPLHRSRATTPSRLVRILSRFREFRCRRWNLASRGAS